MADSKITALTSISTSTDPANDPLVIVDVSDTSMAATGTTKKVTLNQLLGASGTATLASATITGDLTVDTSTLKVDSANNRVGIVQATPLYPLHLVGEFGLQEDNPAGTGTKLRFIGDATKYNFRLGKQLTANNTFEITPSTTVGGTTFSNPVYTVTNDGIHTFLDGAGGTRMTLNSTGLGVGGSPVSKLSLGADSNPDGANKFTFYRGGTSGQYSVIENTGGTAFRSYGTGGHIFYINNGTTEAARIDTSGNLLVGTTSALSSGSTFENLGTARQVLTLKGDSYGSYTFGVWNASTTNDGLFQYFATETTLTVRGSIAYNRAGGLVAYNTTSDYRAKDIIGPVSNSGSIIDSLKVYVGKMKGATIERPMLIAHETQEVAPYAVTGTKDEVDADGKPKYQQMDASALVPLLIAEIQSLRTRVQTLETR